MLSVTKHVTYKFRCDNPQCHKVQSMDELSLSEHLLEDHGYTLKDVAMVIADLKKDT